MIKDSFRNCDVLQTSISLASNINLGEIGVSHGYMFVMKSLFDGERIESKGYEGSEPSIENGYYRAFTWDKSLVYMSNPVVSDGVVNDRYVTSMGTLWTAVTNAETGMKLSRMTEDQKDALLRIIRKNIPLSVAVVQTDKRTNPNIYFYFPYMYEYETDFVVIVKPDGEITIGGNGNRIMDIFDELKCFDMSGFINDNDDIDVLKKMPILKNA